MQTTPRVKGAAAFFKAQVSTPFRIGKLGKKGRESFSQGSLPRSQELDRLSRKSRPTNDLGQNVQGGINLFL
jgi:hypothetical protein